MKTNKYFIECDLLSERQRGLNRLYFWLVYSQQTIKIQQRNKDKVYYTFEKKKLAHAYFGRRIFSFTSAISRIRKWPLQPDFTLVIFLIDMTSYWTYQGSLTTPPMSENVTWIISENIMKISEKQVSLLLSMWACTLFIMTLNGRREKMASDNAQ